MALVPILQQEIERRDHELPNGGFGGGREACALAIAAANVGMSKEAAARRIYAILTGEYRNRAGKLVTQGVVSMDIADKLLTGLDRQEAWHLELAPYVSDPGRAYDPDYELEHTCGACKAWIDFEGSSVAGKRMGPAYSLCYRCLVVELPDPEERPDAAGRVGGRIPWFDVRQFYIAYVEQPHTLESLIGPWAERYGYSGAASAAVALSHAFRKLGLPMRSRHESKKHLSKLRGPSRDKRFSDDFLKKVAALHYHRDVSLRQVCQSTFERFGFRKEKDMWGPLSRSMRAVGYPPRDRIEMTRLRSTKHGLSPRNWKDRQRLRKEAGWGAGGTAGVDIKGRPLAPRCLHEGCSKGAAKGGLWCYAHDPDNREEIEAHLEAMRLRSPRQNPENLVAVGDLPVRLRAGFERSGGWKPLTEVTGITNSALLRYTKMPPEKLVMRDTYDRLASALESLT